MNLPALVDVLIPTRNRACALAVTLACLSAQTMRRFNIIVADQSDDAHVQGSAEVAALARYLDVAGIGLRVERHLPRQGMAEQRAFLLTQSRAPYCWLLDDDVMTEPDLLARLFATITEQGCGFVGSALHGLSFRGEHRPEQEAIIFWNGPVLPERVRPGSTQWQRHHLHSAANLFHLQQALRLGREDTRCYRVAWVGGCVLFDAHKLHAAGGFNFWPELPAEHCGEDVVAQLNVMERYGGCAIVPSGAYHMELPTTLPAREVDAPSVLFA